MEKAKTPIELLREALQYGTGPATWRDLVEDAIEALAETPDLRAERLLGQWLVENPGWTHEWVEDEDVDFRLHLTHRPGQSPRRRMGYQGYGPTQASAILDALRKAGCKDV